MLPTLLLVLGLSAPLEPSDPSAAPTPPSRREVSVPVGRPVLLDGRFSAGEWEDAGRLDLRDGKTLYAKRDSRYLYLALRFGTQRHTGLDLTLAASGERKLQLHVSSAIGLRTPATGGAWSDTAWQPEGWGANTIGTIAGEKGMQVLEPDGFEVQIESALLPPSDLALRWELKRPAWIDPQETSAQLANWIWLRM